MPLSSDLPLSLFVGATTLCSLANIFFARAIARSELNYALDVHLRIDYPSLKILVRECEAALPHEGGACRDLNELLRESRTVTRVAYFAEFILFALVLVVARQLLIGLELGDYQAFASLAALAAGIGVLLPVRQVAEKQLRLAVRSKRMIAAEADDELVSRAESLSRKVAKRERGGRKRIDPRKLISITLLMFFVVYRYVLIASFLRLQTTIADRSLDGKTLDHIRGLIRQLYHELPGTREQDNSLLDNRREWALTPFEEVAARIQADVERRKISENAKRFLSGVIDEELVWWQTERTFRGKGHFNEAARQRLAPGSSYVTLIAEFDRARNGVGHYSRRPEDRHYLKEPEKFEMTYDVGPESSNGFVPTISIEVVCRSRTGCLAIAARNDWSNWAGNRTGSAQPQEGYRLGTDAYSVIVACMRTDGVVEHFKQCGIAENPNDYVLLGLLYADHVPLRRRRLIDIVVARDRPDTAGGSEFHEFISRT